MQLAYDLVGVTATVGHRRGDQYLDVEAAQQWMQIDILDAGLQHKLHRHHYQSHVTMPGLPLTRLILRHAQVAFRILERALDPKALRLHFRQFRHAGGRGFPQQWRKNTRLSLPRP